MTYRTFEMANDGLVLSDCLPDLIVYLRTSPETALERVQARNRAEELGVSSEYLSRLHDAHEIWLVHSTQQALLGNKCVRVVVVNVDKPLCHLQPEVEMVTNEIFKLDQVCG